jgi:hypothetical protein
VKFLRSGKLSIAKEDHWVPLSDLMTGLMMMFLLVALVFMVKVEAEAAVTGELKAKAEAQAKRIQQIAVLYDDIASRSVPRTFFRIRERFGQVARRY